MQLVNCYHPRVIRNKVTGEEIVVSCGRCPACQNNRSLMLTTRCDMETSSHKYCVFATLTYADYDVPQFIRMRSTDVTKKYDIWYIDSSTGEIIDYNHKSIKRHSKKDTQYCYDTKVLPVLSKSDFQKFLKRLRYYANQIENGIKLRYFLTGEYGESTFRPHGHLLLWFDSDTFAQKFKEVIYKAWSHGIVYDPHIVTGSASSYVASYVNGTVRLPSIYTHKQIKPFCIYSKRPALGSMYQYIPTLRETLYGGITSFAFCPPEQEKFTDVRFWTSLQVRFLPRIQRFSLLSNSDRIALYRLVDEHHFEKQSDFAEFIFFRYVRSRANTFVNSYLRSICWSSVLRKKFSKDGMLRSSSEWELKFCKSSLMRFADMLYRAKINAQQLGISISDFVTLMSNYYEKIDKKQIQEYYKFQDEFFKTHPLRDYLLFDYTFVNRVNGKEFDTLSYSDQHYLRLCGVVDDFTSVVNISLEDCIDYHMFTYKHNLLADSLVKKKVQFDYVLGQNDSMSNIKNYFVDE